MCTQEKSVTKEHLKEIIVACLGTFLKQLEKEGENPFLEWSSQLITFVFNWIHTHTYLGGHSVTQLLNEEFKEVGDKKRRLCPQPASSVPLQAALQNVRSKQPHEGVCWQFPKKAWSQERTRESSMSLYAPKRQFGLARDLHLLRECNGEVCPLLLQRAEEWESRRMPLGSIDVLVPLNWAHSFLQAVSFHSHF